MRRNDREIEDNIEIESIINGSPVCRIALSENSLSYIIPVCFEIDIYEGLITNGNPCNWDVRYKSVIGYGKAYFIDGSQEIINALNIILRHYSDKPFAFPENSIKNVTVIKVEIENITGKISGQL